MKTAIEKEEIFNEIKKFLVNNFSVPVENMSLDSAFSDLEMDSLDTLDLINELEQKYSLTLDNAEISKIKTIGAAVECLEKALENHALSN
jgi:acyl carrier protein